jgi:hypothetical protein
MTGMDDIVKQALAKWPKVPHCHDWLGLDARGNWYLRDGQAQALGAFASGAPGARGSLLQHQGLIGFIARNYQADAEGQWHFQNGPQRVYVELQATPWIWRVANDGSVTAHTGQPAQMREVLVDEAGHVYLVTDLGIGLVHTQDMGAVADAIEHDRWQPRPVRAADLPARYGFVPSPQARGQR